MRALTSSPRTVRTHSKRHMHNVHTHARAAELIEGRGHDASADLWSLGVLVFSLLAAATPFASPGYAKHAVLSSCSNFTVCGALVECMRPTSVCSERMRILRCFVSVCDPIQPTPLLAIACTCVATLPLSL